MIGHDLRIRVVGAFRRPLEKGRISITHMLQRDHSFDRRRLDRWRSLDDNVRDRKLSVTHFRDLAIPNGSILVRNLRGRERSW